MHAPIYHHHNQNTTTAKMERGFTLKKEKKKEIRSNTCIKNYTKDGKITCLDLCSPVKGKTEFIVHMLSLIHF